MILDYGPPRFIGKPQKPIRLMYTDISTYILLDFFHDNAYKIKHTAYPDPRPDHCKEFFVIYHTQICSIYVEFVQQHIVL